MRFTLFSTVLVALLAVPAQAQRTLLHCGTVLDPATSMEALGPHTLTIEGNRIAAVTGGFVEAGEGDIVIDLRGAFCMPGLMDMHTHLGGESRKNGYIDRYTVPPAEQALRATEYARTTLLSGFTTVRNVGGREGVTIALRNTINRGVVVGPRMFVAGQSLAIMGGHADPTNGGREDLLGIPDESQGIVGGVDSAIQATRLAIKRGADLIKITATGGVLSLARDGSGPQFRTEEIEAIVETARDAGIKVTAHAHGDEGMRRAVEAGVGSIEHGTMMSTATMDLMIERGTYYVPTITAGRSVADSASIAGYYVPMVAEKAQRIGPMIQSTFANAYERGVPIAFGTDAGVFRHGRNAREFAYMVEAGMPPMEAIRSATVAAADLLDQEANLGALQPGFFADVVAVPRDPLADITVLETRMDFVMKGGVVYKHDGQPTVRL
ncbi:MAG: amidohydrolase family protein [Bacteroidota bacterium]